MAEIPDVVANETVLTNWGNPIRDRTVQRYADATERDTLNPVPVAGDIAYLEDNAFLQLHNGSVWVKYLPANGDGYMTGDLRIESASSKAVRIKRTGGADPVEFYSTILSSEPQNGEIVWSRDGVVQTKIRVLDDYVGFSKRISVGGGADDPSLFDSSLKLKGTSEARLIFERDGQTEGMRFSMGTGGDLFLQTSDDQSTYEELLRFYPGYMKIASALDKAPTDIGCVRNIYTGTGAPTSGLGAVGDVYLQVT